MGAPECTTTTTTTTTAATTTTTVMSHSQLAYVLEFSHARIQLVHTLISTFLS